LLEQHHVRTEPKFGARSVAQFPFITASDFWNPA
jgi:hypothetical protein